MCKKAKIGHCCHELLGQVAVDSNDGGTGRALKLSTGHETPRKRRLVEKEERGSRSSPRLKIPVESSSNWSSPGFHGT
ncbi:unnamed protein product [Brassica rapa]|uniref:Uncharacterized protein n=1 Tax=Brassica campestris TaxID=3711 RepID=A0A8D9DBT4_BRACM|nr:unnamed protein product [Brassica rapa]